MWAAVSARWAVIRAIYGSRRTWLVAPVVIANVYDFLVAQVLPATPPWGDRENGETWPRVADVLGGWPWWGWTILLLALLLVIGIEGAYREIARRARALESPAVALDRASTGAIKLSFSEGGVSEVVGQLRLSVSGTVPVRVERILAVPRVMFYRGQGRRYELGGLEPRAYVIPTRSPWARLGVRVERWERAMGVRWPADHRPARRGD